MARRRKPALSHLTPVIRRGGPLGLLALLAVAALLAIQVWRAGGLEIGDRPPPADPAEPERTYLVERVVDGDTLVLAGGERVRLLGVDTPETVAPNRPIEPLGPEASDFTDRMVEGKRVRLGFDKERRDRYGRLLAYVYLDGLLLNEELIRAGYGEAQLQYPYSDAMKRRFRAAEAEAKEARRGMWAHPASGGRQPPEHPRRAA